MSKERKHVVDNCDSYKESEVLKLSIAHGVKEKFAVQKLPWEGAWGLLGTAVLLPADE